MRADRQSSCARYSVDLRRARWPALIVLIVLGRSAWAATPTECNDLNIEIAATITPERSAVEAQDFSGAKGRTDRCTALAKVSADLREVRAEYDQRHATLGTDLLCDQVRATLDGDAEWLAQHDRVLGCNLSGGRSTQANASSTHN